jgi:O-antigen/teichoic acid export membrane protein
LSFKKNILGSYVSQLYMTVVNIVMVPLYVRYLGTEAFGLVGFFAMLQAWFQLLDMGLTPTMARETALYMGGATSASSLRRLLRTLEGLFIGLAVAGGTAMFLGSGGITTHWLKAQHLPLEEIRRSIQLMSGIIALRWICGLYRGAVTGFERLMWLSTFNMTITTARFVLVIPVFRLFGSTPVVFFRYQLLLAVVETLVLVGKVYSLLPRAERGRSLLWEWQPLRAVLRFSLSVAFIGSVWVMVTQIDKLILSKLLPLGDYAYFTIAVLVASAITILGAPISSALQPRMTRLHAEGDEAGLFHVYRQATQLVGVIAAPAAVLLILFPDRILWMWTANQDLAKQAAPVLALYAAGNFLLVFGAFPYYLQFAKGHLKLHIIGNTLFLLFLIPSIVWATSRWGSIGAGSVWLSANALYLFLWVPFVHHRFAVNLHVKWIRTDISMVLLPPCLVGWVAMKLLPLPQGRLALLGLFTAVGLALLLAAASGSSMVRTAVSQFLKTRLFKDTA